VRLEQQNHHSARLEKQNHHSARMKQKYHHSTKAGATTSSQHEGWSNNNIIIIGQQNEAGATTFCGTLTVRRELHRNHNIP
jgi:hypothetical protein